MSNLINPYEILKIDDFASEETIENAFRERVREFDEYSNLTKKQTDLYSRIHEAYDLLSNQNTKKMIDDDLRLRNNNKQNIRVTEHLSPHDEVNLAQDTIEEEELSREKNIVIGPKNNKSLVTFILYAVIGMAVLFFFLNIMKGNDQAQQANQTKEPSKEESAAPEPPQPINLIANATDIQNNILYPDPVVFKQQNLIFAPDGSVFPLDAQLISTLPQTSSGAGSIVVQNPHPTAIFGKLVVKYTESTEAMVIRYFYIPSKQSLEIFNTPNGTFQIQILTLDKPVAYVSPTFNVPLYSEARTIQKADWAFPHNPETVF